MGRTPGADHEAKGLIGLVERLRRLPVPPADPEALARIIDERAGTDIDLELHRHGRDYAQLRSRTRRKLAVLRKIANNLLSDGRASDHVYPFALTLDDLFAKQVTHEQAEALKPKIIAAVAMLAELPLREDMQEFQGRPDLDARVTEIIRAVAEYWLSVEAQPFGSGLHREVATSQFAFTEGSSASLVNDVLLSLGIDCTLSELETHLKKVREEQAD
jgi:hypothetical protein